MAQIKKEENVRRLSDLIKPVQMPSGVVFCPYITCVLKPDPITGSPHLQTKDKYDFFEEYVKWSS